MMLLMFRLMNKWWSSVVEEEQLPRREKICVRNVGGWRNVMT